MINQLPDQLSTLIKKLQQVPYLASKNIYRVATYFLEMDEKQVQQFCQVLLSARAHVLHCQICFFWKERDGDCYFCSSIQRKQDIICVVESWQEQLSIEKTGGYDGVYHVLGGVISPLEGIGPEDLTIEPLLNRIEGNEVSEVIIATNQTPEGEATAAFIAHKLQKAGVKISCLARGVPVGSSLEFMDRLTVYKALSERRPF